MRIGVLLGVFSACFIPLQAGVIVGTADVGSGNVFPFGGTSGGIGTVYQQVYAASDFSGTIDITSISFFRTQFGSASDTVTDATYTIKLSYSANGVNALDGTTFSNNVGAGQVTFGTYVFSGVTAGSGITFVQNNSDFVYNPATGPLLLEIDLSGIGTRGTSVIDAMGADAGGVFSRAQNFNAVTSFNSNYGLVTGFDVSSVPEPATVTLSGAGLLGLAFLRLRKRSA